MDYAIVYVIGLMLGFLIGRQHQPTKRQVDEKV